MIRTGGRALPGTARRIGSTADRRMTKIDAAHPPNRGEILVASPPIATVSVTPCEETRRVAPRPSSTCPVAPAVALEEIFAAVAVAAGAAPGLLATIVENAAGKETLTFATVIAMNVAASETAITGIESGATGEILFAGDPPLGGPDHPTEIFEIVNAMHYRQLMWNDLVEALVTPGLFPLDLLHLTNLLAALRLLAEVVAL